jgi:glycerophosphoryl diester phosphodiesterase
VRHDGGVNVANRPSGSAARGPAPPPVLIAHRGVPGLRLEHTRPSYELAIEAGADYIEPDLVCTRDGVLVVRHENEISGTTDVADRPVFADRRTTKVVDGKTLTGWFTEDFTLDELKSLRTKERLHDLRPRNQALDGREPILTFEEVLDIAARANAGRSDPVGVYPETKHPTYFRSIGLDLDDRLLAALEARDLNRVDASTPVVIQSMETGNLRGLRPRTPLPLVQLMEKKGAPYDLKASGDARTYRDLTRAEDLAEIATYADGIGPHKNLVMGLDRQDRLAGPTGLVGRAHDAGLFVHVWTMRDEARFRPQGLDAVDEYVAYFDAGVDGVFTDFTPTAVGARERWWSERGRSPSA